MVKKIAVLTSGGDAPGMNAAVRAVTRTALKNSIEMYGVYNGYQGLCDNHIEQLSHNSVTDIINRGGTFLGSARLPEFKSPIKRAEAIKNLRDREIDGLVVIGGDGTYAGARLLAAEGNITCVGLPGTIDNDVNGTDYTIGFFTALQTILDAIDKLRDTSSSHQRISIIEAMGRHCGDLTLYAAIAGGCEAVIVPEMNHFDRNDLVEQIKIGFAKGKRHAIIMITENICNSHELAKYIEQQVDRGTRATILGHIQRGGSPVAMDRVLASRMGYYAVNFLLYPGIQSNIATYVGIQNNQLIHAPIAPANDEQKKSSNSLMTDIFETAQALV